MDFRCARSSRLRSTSHPRFEPSFHTSDWCLKHWDIALSLVMQTIILCGDVFSLHDQTPFLIISVHNIWVFGVISSGRSFEAETVTVYKRPSSRYINSNDILPRVSHHSHLPQHQHQTTNQQCLPTPRSQLQPRRKPQSLPLLSRRPVSSRQRQRTAPGPPVSVQRSRSRPLVGLIIRLPAELTTRAPVHALVPPSQPQVHTIRRLLARAPTTRHRTTTIPPLQCTLRHCPRQMELWFLTMVTVARRNSHRARKPVRCSPLG